MKALVTLWVAAMVMIVVFWPIGLLLLGLAMALSD
jgi:hypothetical protein